MCLFTIRLSIRLCLLFLVFLLVFYCFVAFPLGFILCFCRLSRFLMSLSFSFFFDFSCLVSCIVRSGSRTHRIFLSHLQLCRSASRFSARLSMFLRLSCFLFAFIFSHWSYLFCYFLLAISVIFLFRYSYCSFHCCFFFSLDSFVLFLSIPLSARVNRAVCSLFLRLIWILVSHLIAYPFLLYYFAFFACRFFMLLSGLFFMLCVSFVLLWQWTWLWMWT